MSTTQQPTNRERRDAARKRAAEMRAEQARRDRRKRFALIGGGVLGGLVVIAVIVVTVVAAVGTPAAETGAEGIPVEQGTVLASLAKAPKGATTDGIGCGEESTKYHIHTHLAVYVNGALRPIPAGIGMVQPVKSSTADGGFYEASSCYYWLHVHAPDGIIHIESPTTTTYTLGQFFAVWGQPLTASRVATASGTMTVFVNGKKVAGDPASIVLKSRESIQIDIGKVVPFKTVNWSGSQL